MWSRISRRLGIGRQPVTNNHDLSEEERIEAELWREVIVQRAEEYAQRRANYERYQGAAREVQNQLDERAFRWPQIAHIYPTPDRQQSAWTEFDFLLIDALFKRHREDILHRGGHRERLAVRAPLLGGIGPDGVPNLPLQATFEDVTFHTPRVDSPYGRFRVVAVRYKGEERVLEVLLAVG